MTTQPTIVHHMAAPHTIYPPNSLEAIKSCLQSGAQVIEIDVTPLASDDFLLVHDPVLESETNAEGKVNQCTPQQAKNYRIKHRDTVTAYAPALLSEVVAAFLAGSGTAKLQIDYKDAYPSTSDEPLRRLAHLIEPLCKQVIVSTGADWHLRKLQQIATGLDIGFDIGFYLDWRDPAWGEDAENPPFQRGVYGYHDDHILAHGRILPTANYLAERCEELLCLVPTARIWYVSHYLLAQCLDDGFNMAQWLHEHNVKLDAWTLDVDKPVALAHATRLRDAGVDLFTTNTPTEMASHLKA
jgi:glycerophosphoryl diester phosphodiesterase